MFIYVSFEGDLARSIPASKATLVKIEDGDTRDSFVLDGVSELRLVTDDEGPSLDDSELRVLGEQLGWVPPEAAKELQRENKLLAKKLAEAEKAVVLLQDEAVRRGWHAS